VKQSRAVAREYYASILYNGQVTSVNRH